MKKRANLIASILIGIIIFSFVLQKIGIKETIAVFKKINLFYFTLFFILSSSIFLFYAWKWQMILSAYKKKVGILPLTNQSIAGFAISYATPVSRAGGEPVRAIMLKRESKIPYKIGISSVIIDKFTESVGAIIMGIIGLAFLIYSPEIIFSTKIIFTVLMIFFIFIAFVFYSRSRKNKAIFSPLFSLPLIKDYKSSKKLKKNSEKIEKTMSYFFNNHKKQWLNGIIIYLITGIIFVFEVKYLALSIGISPSFYEIILIITLFGLVSIIPIPGALGFQEASQAYLFSFFFNNPAAGLAYSLLMRLRDVFFTALGFAITSNFLGKQFLKEENLLN